MPMPTVARKSDSLYILVRYQCVEGSTSLMPSPLAAAKELGAVDGDLLLEIYKGKHVGTWNVSTCINLLKAE